ncbi:hypothetical protein [Crenothrix sp.]|uniref:hypothetical protein n=1 Tax=Crenothrix sp. TaxID=3100433 RepID=UPI00374CE962
MRTVSIKRLWILMILPILFSCSSSCRVPADLSPYNCDKCNISTFTPCIKKNFPIGSSYLELNNYMAKIGLKNTKNPDDLKNGRFYFHWWANNLANVKIAVLGHHNEKQKITEIDVIPHVQ